MAIPRASVSIKRIYPAANHCLLTLKSFFFYFLFSDLAALFILTAKSEHEKGFSMRRLGLPGSKVDIKLTISHQSAYHCRVNKCFLQGCRVNCMLSTDCRVNRCGFTQQPLIHSAAVSEASAMKKNQLLQINGQNLTMQFDS